MKSFYQILKYFLIWRIALFIPVIIAPFFLNYGSSYPFFEVSYYQSVPQILNFPLITAWSNFDGVHYLNIALRGYTTEARFFPLLPLVIYFLSFGNFTLAFLVGLILPNLFFLGALFMLYKLIRLDYSEEIAKKTIIFLLIFPASFFFVAVYTESLFLLLLTSSFYLVRKKKWSFSILTAALLVLSRFVGILILPSLIFEFLKNEKLNFKNLLKLSAMIFIIPLGLLLYSLFNKFTWGEYLYFLSSHSELGNSRSSSLLILPPQTIYRYFKIFLNLPPTIFEYWLSVFELMAFFFGAVLIFAALKKKIRTSYLIFAVLAFLVPVLSGTFSGLPRYLLIIFPIFLGLALVKSETVKRVYISISAVLLFLALMFFSRGYFIA